MPDHEARRRAVYDHDSDEPRTNARRRRPAADWGVGEELFDHMPRRRFGRDESHRPSDHEPPIPRGGADDGRRTIVIGDDEPLPPAVKPPAGTDEEFASREDALRAREQHDAVWAGDEPFAPERAPQDDAVRAGDEPFAPERAPQNDALRAGDEPFAPERAPQDDAIWADDEPFAPERAPQDDAVWSGDEPFAPDSAPQPEDQAAPADDLGTERADTRGRAMPLRPVVEDRRVEGRRTVKIGGHPGDLAAPSRHRPARTVSDRVGHRPTRFAAWAFALGLLLILIAVATAMAGT